MTEQPLHLTATNTNQTTEPCHRCGTPTTGNTVLADENGTTRHSLPLCPSCHQPRHRAD